MTEPLLRASFEFGPEEHADVVCRHLQVSPRHARFRVRATVLVAAFVLVLAWVIDRAYAPDREPMLRAIVLALPMVLVAVIYWLQYPRRQRANVLARLRRLHGNGPHRCDVEVFADQIVFRQQGKTALAPWREFTSVRPVGIDLELLGPRSALVVRGHAFATSQERQAFHDRVQELHRHAVAPQ
jgi:hypothetical protein